MINPQADAAERFAIYRRLAARNRIVTILRIGVPVLGAIILVALVGQIYLSSLANRFGIGRVEVTRDSIKVEAPQYSGVLEDGTTYHVWAANARAALDASDQIVLTDAALTMQRLNGVTMDVAAPSAVLDTTREVVVIEGIAHVEDSTGTAGTIVDSVFDYAGQTLLGKGAVHIDYADGTTLDGTGMTYDAVGMVWTFSRASVNLAATPGTATSETATP